MNSNRLISIYKLVFIFTLLALPSATNSKANWGFYAHRKINNLAVFTLPEDLFHFYKKHIDFVTEHAVDPDKRRYGVVGEAPRHYIDIDHYCHQEGCDPFEEMPRSWTMAVEKYTRDTLEAYGIVPWHISWMVKDLTEAFQNQKKDRILRLSAELGHYVGDAHVPLHTTENYNGQMTNQKGIHGFWESRIPELFDLDYDFFVGKARYVEAPLDFAWKTVEASHAGVDSVLLFEQELNESFPSDRKYVHEERGRVVMKNYSIEYSQAYHDMLDGQVERRMKQAVIAIGSLWYTAWVNAGQPNLELLETAPLPEDLENEIAKENELPPIPELQKRSHDN
jgi:hypothetical protein